MGSDSLAAVYSAANFQLVDWWETRLIPKNQNKIFEFLRSNFLYLFPAVFI